MGWDGEGITYPGDTQQSYVLFGASSDPRHRRIGRSLSTVSCLDLLLEVESELPTAIHMGFGFGYDVNMILRDVPYGSLERLYKSHHVTWNGYHLDWLPGKWFNVRKGKTTVRVFEAFGFFQSSFLIACEKFLGKDDPLLKRIADGKQQRKQFEWGELHSTIVPYWEAELEMFVRLMETLRNDLVGAGFKLHSWHGPGAVANTVLKSRGVDEHKSDPPPDVKEASRYAYAGGRFELFRCGHHPGKVWQYDINSAYPAATTQLPSFARGEWRYTETFDPTSDSTRFGVWSVERVSHDADMRHAHPCFYRDKQGNVSFPPITAGWYWTPEAELVADHVTGGWVFDHDGSLPFSWVEEMYEQRKIWKAEGNSSERALKLALNSLYGKMAQRAGWNERGQIPKWHQLEWAGYITSATRRKMWDAMQLAGSSLIAVETDAVFCTEPLPELDTGKALGQWSETVYDWMTYVQSGMWFGSLEGELVEKYRGFDRGSLPHDRVLRHLREPSTPLYGDTTRFVGLGIALHTNAVWRSWVTGPRRVQVGGGGKRAHIVANCDACRTGVSFADGLHELSVTTAGGRSHPHALPWVDDPIISMLRLEDELTAWS